MGDERYVERPDPGIVSLLENQTCLPVHRIQPPILRLQQHRPIVAPAAV